MGIKTIEINENKNNKVIARRITKLIYRVTFVRTFYKIITFVKILTNLK